MSKSHDSKEVKEAARLLNQFLTKQMDKHQSPPPTLQELRQQENFIRRLLK